MWCCGPKSRASWTAAPAPFLVGGARRATVAGCGEGERGCPRGRSPKGDDPRRRNSGESACRRDSVQRFRGTAWVAIHLSGLPGISERAARSLLGLAPGGVYKPPGSPRTLVRSYRTFSPLPVTGDRSIGGVFSVALSVASRRLVICQHPALRSPDLPRHGRPRGAAMPRPPGRLTTAVTLHRRD